MSSLRLREIAVVVVLTAAALIPLGVDIAVADAVELPDLVSVPPTRVQQPETVNWAGATSLVIRFDGHVTNVGEGPLDLFGNPSTGTVSQRARSGDDWVDVTSPQVVYESADGHNHWHLMKVARYSLWNESKTAEVAPGQKEGFCLYDVTPVSGAPVTDPAFYQGSVVRWCEVGNPLATELRMGISAGHQDVYDKSLTYQWVDVSDVQPGVYWVAAQIDPENVVVEANEANNTLSFSQSSVTVPGHIARPIGPVPVGSSPVAIQLESQSFGSSDRVFRVVEAPQYGTLDVAVGATIWGDSVVYTPASGYDGVDTFKYVAVNPTSAYPLHPAMASVVLDLGADLPPSVTISGAPASLIAGTSALLSASIVNAGIGIDWYVDGVLGGNTTYGTVVGSGLYRAPSVPPPAGFVTIRAQSRDVPLVFDEVTIAIDRVPEAPVVVAPSAQRNVVGDDVELSVVATDANGDPIMFSAQGLPPGLTIDGASGVISGRPTVPGSYIVTVHAGDGGLTGSASFSWVIDALPPLIGALPDMTIGEGETAIVDLAVTDPQGLPYICAVFGAPFVTKSGAEQLMISPGFEDAGSSEVIVEVTNDAGLSATTTFTVTVADVNRPPIVGYLPDRSIAEGGGLRVPLVASDPDGDPVSVVVAGPPFVSYDAPSRELVITPGYSDAGSSLITVSASDPLGATSGRSFTLVIENTNRPPVIESLGDLLLDEAAVVRVPVVVVDPDQQSVTLVVDGPGFVSYDADRAEVVIAPGYDDSGSHRIVVMATDVAGAATSESFVATIRNVNRSPELAPLSPQIIAEGESMRLALSGFDPDGDALSFTAVGAPFVAVDAAANELVLTPGFEDAGDVIITVTATDDFGANASRQVALTVTDVNRHPQLGPLANVAMVAGEVATVELRALDPDGDHVTVTVSGAPFASVVAGSVELHPGWGDEGSHDISVMVADGRGGSAAADFTVSVTVVNHSPQVSVPAEVTVSEGSEMAIPLLATDVDGHAVSWSMTGPGFAHVHAATGLLTVRPGFGDAGVYEFVVTATDPLGLSDSAAVSIIVVAENRAPSLPIVHDFSTPTTAQVSLPVGGADPDGDVLSYSATGLPPGIAINHDTGVLTGTIPFTAAGRHQVTIRANDGVLTASTSFEWTITDQAPEAAIAVHVTGRGERVVIELSARPSVDPEGGSLRYFWDLDGDGDYDDARRWWTTLQTTRGTIEVGLLVVDPAGNRSEARLVIEIS